jgi:hypothetical protein
VLFSRLSGGDIAAQKSKLTRSHPAPQSKLTWGRIKLLMIAGTWTRQSIPTAGHEVEDVRVTTRPLFPSFSPSIQYSEQCWRKTESLDVKEEFVFVTFVRTFRRIHLGAK